MLRKTKTLINILVLLYCSHCHGTNQHLETPFKGRVLRDTGGTITFCQLCEHFKKNSDFSEFRSFRSITINQQDFFFCGCVDQWCLLGSMTSQSWWNLESPWILTMTPCGGAVKSTYFAGEETKAQRGKATWQSAHPPRLGGVGTGRSHQNCVEGTTFSRHGPVGSGQASGQRWGC